MVVLDSRGFVAATICPPILFEDGIAGGQGLLPRAIARPAHDLIQKRLARMVCRILGQTSLLPLGHPSLIDLDPGVGPDSKDHLLFELDDQFSSRLCQLKT